MLTMKDVRHLMEKYHMTCHKVNKNRKKTSLLQIYKNTFIFYDLFIPNTNLT